MSKTINTLLTLALALCVCSVSYGQANRPAAEEKTATFRFVAGDDMFYIPWSGNDAELERLYALADEYRAEIASGAMPVYVDGCCASLPTVKENLKMAFIRANRVKSELITNKGLKEADFITKNHAEAFDGHKDMVVVTLRIPARTDDAEVAARRAEQERLAAEKAERERLAAEQAARERAEAERLAAEQAERERAEAERLAAERAEAERLAAQAAAKAKPYCMALRTNVLYDALLLPTLGVEWRVNRDLGLKLDGSLAWWGDEHGKVQKMWIVNPEVRWYLLDSKRFYAGVSGSYGEYNIYKYPLGNLLKDDTGYQGTLWNVGLTVGYQLRLARQFSVDFNLGLGYTRSEYDSFGMTDKVRVYKERDKTKSFWGPTQAGISLVWTIGGNK